MALVAYDYSSSEESEDECTVTPCTASEGKLKDNTATDMKSSELELPPVSTTHLTLPAPRSILNGLNIVEEDDEFLRKTAVPVDEPLPKPITTHKTRKGKVQIMVPSLKDFKEDSTKRQPKSIIGADMPKKPTGLLGMLPKPKSETSFAAPSAAAPSNPSTSFNKPTMNRLIPDSVANRPRSSTSDPKQKKAAVVPKAAFRQDSDDSGDEDKVDFFSLNRNEDLPEISVNEINVMVAKRAARMAETAKQFDQNLDAEEPQPTTSRLETAASSTEAVGEDLANERALSSLIGGNKAKRARLHEVNIIDINSTDIVPSKEDFLRRKLQDETGFVPTGHLTGDWTCTSKRKSHITYLASKAQDNAQELEAMWASNRQSRRQTQSKYGF